MDLNNLVIPYELVMIVDGLGFLLNQYKYYVLKNSRDNVYEMRQVKYFGSAHPQDVVERRPYLSEIKACAKRYDGPVYYGFVEA